MPRKDSATLLSLINKEIREKGATTIDDLPADLQQDINDSAPIEIVKGQGLRATHNYLLSLTSKQFQHLFEWPGAK